MTLIQSHTCHTARDNQRRHVANLFTKKEKQYCDTLFHKRQHDYKTIFKLSNASLFRKEDLAHPRYEDPVERAIKFNDFLLIKLRT